MPFNTTEALMKMFKIQGSIKPGTTVLTAKGEYNPLGLREQNPIKTPPAKKQANTEQKPATGLMKFKATHYNPYDRRQNRPDATDANLGVGALNRKVEWGDVAAGERAILNKAKANKASGKDTFIFIKELSDLDTPYGKGIFRVNDAKNIRYDGIGPNFDIAVPNSHPNAKDIRNRIGNNSFTFEYK